MKKVFKILVTALFVLSISVGMSSCKWWKEVADDYAKVTFKKHSYEDIYIKKIQIKESSSSSGWNTKWEAEENEKYIKKSISISSGTYIFNISGYSIEEGTYLFSEDEVIDFAYRTSEITVSPGSDLVILFDEEHAWVEGSESE
ncbi:MAG: hypothetical protein K5829_10575 [Treponema sp.]|nr:hypothetical protein [Treponema sp.]